jgi:hypothetical protein
MSSFMALSQEVHVNDLPAMPSGEVLSLQEGYGNDPALIPSGYVIKFERTGGYFGACNSFWIYADGRVINDLGKTTKIPPAIVTEWVNSIPPSAEIPLSDASMKSWTGTQLCDDCLEYLVTIYDKHGTRTLKSSDTLNKYSDDAANILSGMRDRLLHLKWK